MDANFFLIFYHFVRVIFFIIEFIKWSALSEYNVSYRLFLSLHFSLKWANFVFYCLHKTFLFITFVTIWAAKRCRISFEKILFLMLHLIFKILFLLLFGYFFLNYSFINTFSTFLYILHCTCYIVDRYIIFKVFLFQYFFNHLVFKNYAVLHIVI